MVLPLLKHRFTVDDYHRMADAGIFDEDSRVELLDGEIVDMSPIGRSHIVCVDRLNRLFVLGLGKSVIVRVQSSVRLSDLSEPQPDVALLRDRPDFYADSDAGPDDVLLLVEVADSSLRYDLHEKGPLYATAGVPEYWVVDLSGRAIIVHRNSGAGGYETMFRVRGAETVSPVTLPELALSAEQVLG